MPSSQTPPVGGTALDPTAFARPSTMPRSMRVDAGRVARDARSAQGATASRCCSTSAASTIRAASRVSTSSTICSSCCRRRAHASPRSASRERVRVLCGVPASDPTCRPSSICGRSADWAEREVFDLFGIAFRRSPGSAPHPDAGRLGRLSAAQGLSAARARARKDAASGVRAEVERRRRHAAVGPHRGRAAEARSPRARGQDASETRAPV